MENLLKQIEELRERLLGIWELLDIDGQISEIKNLKLEASKPDFWNNREHAVETGQKLEGLESEVKRWEDLKKEIRDLEELVAVAENEKDSSIDEDARAKYSELKEQLESWNFLCCFQENMTKKTRLFQSMPAQAELTLRTGPRFWSGCFCALLKKRAGKPNF